MMIVKKAKLWVKLEQRKILSIPVHEQYRKVYNEMCNFNIE